MPFKRQTVRCAVQEADGTLRVRFSKTDQEGEGEYLYLCEDTRLIVQKWLKRSELTEGYLFRRMTARGDNLYVNKDTGEPFALTADGVRKIIKSCAAWWVFRIRCRGIPCGLGQPYLWHRLVQLLWIFRLRVAGRIRVCPHTTPAPSSPSAAQSHDLRMGSDD